jgi:hypothetical protein
MHYIKYLFIFSFLLFYKDSVRAQFITATEVETWKSKNYPSADFNLNSAYVYLLNGHEIGHLFEGEGMSKSEKKEIGIHKGDFPRYAYLALQMPDPSKPGEHLTYPMMIHDVRDPKNQKRMMHYGGRYLENIPDEVLKNNDLYAKVHFESIKGNGDASFWKKAAKISLDLGKTATNLAAMSLTGNFLNVTQQMLPQITQGLTSLKKAEEEGKISSEFYIKLLSKELSALYEERVVAASLYKLHWDNDKPSKTRFFRNATAQKVDDLKAYVKSSKSVYILVVNTKSEYNTDHSTIAYTPSYIEKKTNDFRKIRNATKREVEKEFLESLKQGVELKRQIDIFEKSLNTKYPDWLAYSRIADLYYSIQQLNLQEGERLSKIGGSVHRKYSGLYDQLLNDVSLWFKTDLLTKNRNIVEYIIDNEHISDFGGKGSQYVYNRIQLLHYLRDRVAQTENQGRIPKEIEGLEVYKQVNYKLEELETALYQIAFRDNPNSNPEEQKKWLYKQTTELYPLCKLCADKVREEVIAIDNATYEENLNNFKTISMEYYDKMDCYEKVLSGLDAYIREGLDSLQLSETMATALEKDKESFKQQISTYADIAGKDYSKLDNEALDQLMSQYYLNREKLMTLIDRLRPMIQEQAVLECMAAQP